MSYQDVFIISLIFLQPQCVYVGFGSCIQICWYSASDQLKSSERNKVECMGTYV